MGGAGVCRPLSAAARHHPRPAVASARRAGAVRLRPTGSACSELPATPLARSGASGAEGGGKHPPACGSALRSDVGRQPRAGAAAAARPGPVMWEAGLGRARASRAAESADFME